MKNLFLILILIAGGWLFFHDKKEGDDLSKAQSDNAELSRMLSDKEAAYNALLVKFQQMRSLSPQSNALSPPPGRGSSVAPTSSLPGSALDRPAYHN